MFATFLRTTTAAFAVAAFSTGAHGEYRCNPPPSWVDREACKAATQGPDELRRFIQRMGWMRINLGFADYSDAKTAQDWNARPRQQALRRETAAEAVAAPG